MEAGPSHEDRLRTNYNTVGVAVMQAMYSDDYLSIGGIESTNDLAHRAGVTSASRVLDIGCGVGGPMLQLAEAFGCRVTGLDLVDTSIDRARQLAADRGLDTLATFEQGDAAALPFADQSFDVVWGQDAWCHIPDKPAMLAEAARVLRPGGTIAFTDWVVGQGMTEDERHRALDAAVSTTAVSTGDYQALLTEAGFVNSVHQDISASFVARYQTICAGLHERRSELIAQFGDRVFAIVAETNGTILRGFEGGAIGGARFVATLPS